MYSIGPLLVKTKLFEHRIPGPYYWLYIEINDENTVLKFSVAPFLLSDTRLLRTFKFYNAEIGIFYVFDPASESYFALFISDEHELVKFRQLNAPLNFQLHLGEVLSSGGYTPLFPTILAPHHVMNGCQSMYNELHNNQELMSCIKSQYQDFSEHSLWNIEKQDIDGVSSISSNTKEALIKNGLLLALNYLKTESKSAQTYCYALASIITKKNISVVFKNKLSAEVSLIEEAEQLARYMIDATLYDVSYPLNEELFEEIKHIYISEIDKYKEFESGDNALLAIKQEDFCSFTEALHDFNAENLRAHINTHYSEDVYFLMLTNQAPIPADGVENLQACLSDLKHNERMRKALMERYDMHFDGDFEDELQNLINRIDILYKYTLKYFVKKCLDEGLSNIAFCEKLKPIIKDSSDVRLLLNILNTDEIKCALIDSLEVHKSDCAFMQNMNDFFNFSIKLKHDPLNFLFMKRTPQEWSKFIVKFDDLLLFLKIIKTHENKLLFISGNRTYLILEDFIEKIPQQFKQQILERIKEEPEEHNNQKLLDILQKNPITRFHLHAFGLFRDNEIPPPIEQPFKCARLSYK